MNTGSKDGITKKYPIYKSGEDYFIGGYKVPEINDIEDKTKTMFNAEVIESEIPYPLH